MIVQSKGVQPHHLDLTCGQFYYVIGVEADDLRLLNDRGKPYLYPAALFEIVDARESADWIVELGEDGERSAYPQPLNTASFFEDFFDANRQAVATFWQVVNQRLAATLIAA